MTEAILQTTVVGSYPQPDWLVDRAMLSKVVPRTRMKEIWRVPEPFLEQAQDDATQVAIRDMERAGIDVVTDGEIRRESYSNRARRDRRRAPGRDREPCRPEDRGAARGRQDPANRAGRA
jgi:hypothetical protein